VTVDCNPPQKVVIDGEILEVNPIDFSIVPGGLKVIAPRK
jgi:diacylglycerol kinase family enzyme